MNHLASGQRLFRLWIVTYHGDWMPRRWNEAPPAAQAVEPVDGAAYSAAEAAMFLEGFNSAMLEADRPIWAVAVPVTIRYEGDAQCGASVTGFVFADGGLGLQDPRV
jgi:hypothetical protein